MTVSTETELKVTLLTIPEVIEKYAPNLPDKIKACAKEGTIKINGAIDEIPNKKKKDIMQLDVARIIEQVQRVDDIEEGKIIENLIRFGGFCHNLALVGDVFGFEGEEYKSGTDTLHRWLMAYLCGVTEVAVNEHDVHPEDATTEEILEKEKVAFDARNKYNAKVSDTSKKRVNKETGTWSAKEQTQDATLKSIGIHINSYGAPQESAYFVFKTFSEFEKLIDNPNHPCYVDPGILSNSVKYFSDELDKGIEDNPRLFGALCVVYSNYLKNKKDRDAFGVWLEDKSNRGFGFYDANWWTAKVQHTRNMENTTLRILCVFNEYRRVQLKRNIIEPTDLKDLLSVMNVETNQFVQECIVSETPVSYSPTVSCGDDESLDDEFNI